VVTAPEFRADLLGQPGPLPPVTYDLLTLGGDVIEAGITGGRLNDLLSAIDDGVAVRVHAEDHTGPDGQAGATS